MTDENKNNSINGHYKYEKNLRRTGGEFHVNSACYPQVMPGGGECSFRHKGAGIKD